VEYNEFHVSQLEKCINFSKVNWLNVHGLNETETIKSIGDYLKVDSFMLSDILNTTKRTKIDEYHDVLFFNIKSLLPATDDKINVEQISFLLKKIFWFPFKKSEAIFLRIFENVLEHIRELLGIKKLITCCICC
jgi:magnesium transporter